VAGEEGRLARGVSAALGSALLMTAMAAVVHVSRSTIPSGELLSARGLCAVVLLFPVVRRQGVDAIFRREAAALWARCAAGVASIYCYFWTLQQTSVGGATALADTAPLFVLTCSAILLKEQVRRVTVIAALVAVCGALLVHEPWRSAISAKVAGVGLFGALFAGMAYASLRAAAGRYGRELVVWCLGWFMIAGGLATFSDWQVPSSLSHWASLVGVGAFGLVGQLALTTAYRELPAALAATLGLSGLLFGVLFDLLAGRAFPQWIEWGGYLLVLIGGLGATLVEANRS
jgi:drug/metabolite transporter (DMT)-like permease